MSDRMFIIPEFGPLAGMRIIDSGSLIAMPFAATMLADSAPKSFTSNVLASATRCV